MKGSFLFLIYRPSIGKRISRVNVKGLRLAIDPGWNTMNPGRRFCSDGEKPLPKGRKIGKNFFRVLKRFYPILEIFNRGYSEKSDTFVGARCIVPLRPW
jgi:hypothetical protein